MTRKEVLARFIADIERWTYSVFDAYGTSDAVMKKKINKWIASLRPLWYSGMLDLNLKTSYDGMSGLGITLKEFEKNYKQTVTALSRIDWTKATVLQRGLVKNFGKNGYKTFFSKYDEMINNFSAKPLKEVQKAFLKSTAGKKVSFIDKTGREWNPKAYASMWSRTRSSEVANETMLAEMKAVGSNVVHVTDTGTTTPICILYENKYFSLDGKNGLPKLEFTTPFHPNCRHRQLAVTDTNLEAYKISNRKQDAIIKQKSSSFTDAEWRQIEKQKAWLKANRPV